MRAQLALLFALLLAAPGVAQQPNIVLIIADDMGVDLLSVYRSEGFPPCTPAINQMARDGLVFRNAWSNPSCTTSRAHILTGLHGIRSGVGQNIVDGPSMVLPPQTLPRAMTELGYATALVGKWHLANEADLGHANAAGFSYAAGSWSNLVGGPGDPNATYDRWVKTVQGEQFVSSRYATRDTTVDAQEMIETLPEPFFLQVAYNAPHKPFHIPEERFCPNGCSATYCVGREGGPGVKGRAMLEALDRQIGLLLNKIDNEAPNTIVVFIGDNGTASGVVVSPNDATRAKATLYQGGIHVPLIVRGPNVVTGNTQALVSTVDMLATFVELGGGIADASLDSVSFASVLGDRSARPRDTVYAEKFKPNFDPALPPPPFSEYRRAIRDTRYKLLRRRIDGDIAVELYDLRNDPTESENLYPPTTPGTRSAFEALTTRMVALGGAPGSDVNGSGRTDLSDLGAVLRGFGTAEPSLSDGDTNLDGDVDLDDLYEVLMDFGRLD